jgi:hypothetical protein
VPKEGVEPEQASSNSTNLDESTGADAPKSTESVNKGSEKGPGGPGTGPAPDVVEVALARALEAAAGAKEWALVAKLAGELEARRRRRP